MPLSSPTRKDWKTINRRMKEGRFTPIISGRVTEAFLPDRDNMLNDWAADIEYPSEREANLTDLIRYYGLDQTETAAVEEYLYFAKGHLLDAADSDQRLDIDDHSFTELAKKLNQPSFETARDNPVSLLAKLNLPIYITTSQYHFLEDALRAEGKEPESEVCQWRSGPLSITNTAAIIDTGQLHNLLVTRISENDLRTFCFRLDIDYEILPSPAKDGKLRDLLDLLRRQEQLPLLIRILRQSRPDLNDDLPDIGHLSVFDREPGYQPTAERPLVYHLYGVDTIPQSLVLTEDDFLDFLIKVSWDKFLIPVRVQEALADTSLLLLGYHLDDWEFKVLFRGLIASKRASRRALSIAIQLEPRIQPVEARQQDANIQKYIHDYFFDRAKFRIYWGDPQSFMKELWKQVGGS